MNNLKKELLAELGRTQIQLLGIADKLNKGVDEFYSDSLKVDFKIFQERRRLIVNLLENLEIFEETDKIINITGASMYLENTEVKKKER